jgi:hypothetical protein
MAHSGGIIESPVSIQDVRAVLGDSSTVLGNLCDSEKLNPWAKYKPVRWSIEDGGWSKLLTGDDEAWRGTDGMCGFAIPVYTVSEQSSESDTLSSLQSVLGNGLYNQTGLNTDGTLKTSQLGTKYPARLSDFDGYNHNVIKKFVTSAAVAGGSSTNWEMDKYGHLNVSVALANTNDKTAIKWTDLKYYRDNNKNDAISFADMYWGVYFRSQSSNTGFWAWAAEPIKSATYSDFCELDLSGASGISGDYKYYICARSKDCTIGVPVGYESKKINVSPYGSHTDAWVSDIWFNGPRCWCQIASYNGGPHEVITEITASVQNDKDPSDVQSFYINNYNYSLGSTLTSLEQYEVEASFYNEDWADNSYTLTMIMHVKGSSGSAVKTVTRKYTLVPTQGNGGPLKNNWAATMVEEITY